MTGETAGGCVVKETFQVVQTPFYLPTVEGTLQAVCPGDSAYVEVIPDADENFVSYTWVGDWNGGRRRGSLKQWSRRLADSRGASRDRGG